MFWDASALIPLFLEESSSQTMREIACRDDVFVVWWGTILECRSALSRSEREGNLTERAMDLALESIKSLSQAWSEVLPSERVRTIAARLLMTHPLKTAHALQLAAAIVWADSNQETSSFVCLDARLGTAARKEGFALLPATLEALGEYSGLQ